MVNPIRPEVAKEMKHVAKAIEHQLPEGFGFALFVFDFSPKGYISYMSNAQRPDMLRALKEFIANAEADARKESH
jgi:hypothetical protein